MNSSCILKDGSKLEYQASYQTITFIGGPVPDPEWTFTDVAGHTHKYGTPDNAYPTLKPVWTLGYCGTCNDLHEEGDLVDYYVCAECGAKIEPSVKWHTPNPITVCTSQEILHSGWVTLSNSEVCDSLNLDKYVQVITDGSGVRAQFCEYLSPDQAKDLVEQIGIKQPPRRTRGSMRVGHGGAGNDPSIPECPGCGAYGGGGHGGGCPDR